ncbi:uncharacterized protein LOC132700316 isoform X2 [Cylas formicarius]|uniref:uncharacterized protein LOC132700316 isoform X2 n=1 Tax=Cylas formicarius TaxID=197179 RepID=UPI002958C1D8|nr:uncharacterized protein LOC132700316 isoform X2 [Cylas formicarius]
MEDLVDYIDAGSVQFVNPYEINPVIGANMSPVTDPLQYPTQEDVDSGLSGGTSPPTLADVKVKMEEFGDLTHLVAPLTDELSTPVFEKDAFDFTTYVTRKPTKTNNNDTYNIKVESCNAYAPNADKHVFSGDLLFAGLENEVPILLDTYSDKDVESGDQIISTLTDPIVQRTSSVLYSTTTAAAPTYITRDVSSPSRLQYGAPVTPEDSDSCDDAKRQLKLNFGVFGGAPAKPAVSLNTPDIIEEVVDLAGDNFNILDLVDNEDLQALGVEDDLLSSLSSPRDHPPSTPSTPSYASSTKRPRKRRYSFEDDDEDEDYKPPTSKRRPSTVRLRDIDVEATSSDDDYDEGAAKRRTPKRRGSAGGRVDHYRELRDKNNEASRKSRLKRKIRELEFEKEADELHVRNIKLKAQVEELEKMVSTFRNNLFQILVKK